MEDPLAPDLIATILANEGLEAVAQFVQEQSAAGSQRDYNSDGEITSTELLAFWDPETFAHLDKNSDNVITVDETDEAAWRFVADADHDEDGCIDLLHASHSVSFMRRDVDRDGQLSEHELSSEPFDRYDKDGDGKISKTEFIEGRQSQIRRLGPITDPPTPPLTPEQKFANNDLDSDGQASEDEAPPSPLEQVDSFRCERGQSAQQGGVPRIAKASRRPG
jgi:Ca2+-binding EF-hand superfamily protein